MAEPERLEPSRRLSQAAFAEREGLLRRLAKLDGQITATRSQLGRLRDQRKNIVKRLALLNELVPHARDRPLQSVASDTEEASLTEDHLRGAEIRRVAVRVLAANKGPNRPIHYTHWLELVRKAGFAISGQDPAATFLTQINRSALVVRGDEPGVYMVDADAPNRLRARLKELHSEVLALNDGQQTLEAVVSTRQRREELVGEITRVERKLEEALAVLGTGS
jgi:hypothetical protein